MNDAGDLSATLGSRHRHRVADEMGLAVAVHRPADDAAAEHIEHDRQVEPALHRRHVGHVSDPLVVRRGRGEVPVDQVWRRHRVRICLGRVLLERPAVHAMPAAPRLTRADQTRIVDLHREGDR
jgi:hypothetical protein